MSQEFKDLADIAKMFDATAETVLGQAPLGDKQGKFACQAKAEVWWEAAEKLRSIKLAPAAAPQASAVITADDLESAFYEGVRLYDTLENAEEDWDGSDAKKVAEAKDRKLFVIQGNDFPSKIVRGTEAQVTALVAKLNNEDIERVKGMAGYSVKQRIYWRHYEFAVEDLR